MSREYCCEGGKCDNDYCKHNPSCFGPVTKQESHILRKVKGHVAHVRARKLIIEERKKGNI